MSASHSPGGSPRLERLKLEKERLDVVNRESDYVQARAAYNVTGAPERYIVTFKCRGIIGIDANKNPIYGNNHEVQIYCTADYPGQVPHLRWITPIWHPNILHVEPKDVCINKREWFGGHGLDRLCWLLFDMVQYRNYHASSEPPFPLDLEAAKWVRTFAEPNNIVNKRKHIYVDDKPFFRKGSGAMIESLPSPAMPVPVPVVDVPPAPTISAPPTIVTPPGPVLVTEQPRRKKVTFGQPAGTPIPPAVATSMQEGTVCRVCGASMRSDDRSCPNCGSPKRRVQFT